MMTESNNWESEFLQANFVDQRLKTCFFKIMDAFATTLEKFIWAATGSRSSAKASISSESIYRSAYNT